MAHRNAAMMVSTASFRHSLRQRLKTIYFRKLIVFNGGHLAPRWRCRFISFHDYWGRISNFWPAFNVTITFLYPDLVPTERPKRFCFGFTLITLVLVTFTLYFCSTTFFISDTVASGRTKNIYLPNWPSATAFSVIKGCLIKNLLAISF